MPGTIPLHLFKERFAQAMVSLGSEEIQSMIDQDGGAEAICHFVDKSISIQLQI